MLPCASAAIDTMAARRTDANLNCFTLISVVTYFISGCKGRHKSGENQEMAVSLCFRETQ